MKIGRIALALAATLLLASCLFPGKFVSTLDIRRDRGFSFTYVGEVYAMEESDARPTSGEDGEQAEPTADESAAKKAKQEADRRAIADALSKEQGYRSVRYLGEGKFQVDYAVSGKLDHGFLFPFNSDAEAVFPWLAIELRKDGTVRMKAPAFGDEGGAGGPSLPGLGGSGPAEHREGSFTLTTDAEIVMHNVEAGVTPGPVKTLVWSVRPDSKTVPTAVLRFAN